MKPSHYATFLHLKIDAIFVEAEADRLQMIFFISIMAFYLSSLIMWQARQIGVAKKTTTRESVKRAPR